MGGRCYDQVCAAWVCKSVAWAAWSASAFHGNATTVYLVETSMFYTAGSGDDSVGSGQMRFEKRHENSAVGLAWRGLALAVLACSIGQMVALMPSAYADDHKLWAALKQGEAFAIMRHALAPGVGDPDNFSVEECATQRNLSADGRAQARTTGEKFRRNGIKTARVYSSAWCRCKDTAVLLGLGKVEVLNKLNSFFQDYGQRAPQTTALKEWLENAPLQPPLVPVTHQVNISALTGLPTRSGEVMVVARLDGSKRLEVVGLIGE